MTSVYAGTDDSQKYCVKFKKITEGDSICWQMFLKGL